MQTYQAYYLTKITNANLLDDKIGNIKVCIMKPIDFFKLQAKNLHRDYNTQTTYFDESIGCYLYRYNPQYYDLESILLDFNIPEDNFKLMNAQHVVAKLSGFDKWRDMVAARDIELELAKLLFENMHKICIQEWKDYIAFAESGIGRSFDAKTKLEIFKKVWLPENDMLTLHTDYRISPENQIYLRKERPHHLEPELSETIFRFR